METLATQLVAIHPAAAIAHQMLGIARLSRGNAAAAVAPLTRAGELAPADAGVWDNLGAALNAMREFSRAADAYSRSLTIDPDDPRVLSNAAANANDALRLDEAADYAARALRHDPALAHAHLALGNALAGLGRRGEAMAALREAVRLAPTLPQAWLSLGNALQLGGDTQGAIEATQRALTLAPNYADAQQNLGRFHHDLGDMTRAAQHYRAALQLVPQRLDAWSGWLFCLAHDANVTPAEMFAAHRQFGEFVERPWRERWGGWTNERDAARRLRVGFVSGDLREHAVAHFIDPIWRDHDRDDIEVWAYMTNPHEDARSAELRGLADVWQNVAALGDDALAARIRDDRIDVLFDLAGHTAFHRLGVFARKPAPLQVSWIGYPNTTGMTAIDYRPIGRRAAEPGLLEGSFSEKLVYMTLGTVFQPPPDLPPVNPLPALERGHLTFGSFNRPIKLTDAVIAVWSRVLRALPDARLLIGSVGDAQVQARVTGRFGELGIVPGRLEFHPRVSMREYLELHHRVDVILDTFPFTGGTTSNHALWMGVPILTLTGDTLPNKQGAGIMRRAELDDWVASDEAAFVARAVAIDLPALATLRAELRGRLEASCDEEARHASRTVATAVRMMWQRWCTGAPAASFEVTP